MLYSSMLIDQGRVIAITERVGLLGPFFIGLLFIFSHVFAPFSSIPFVLISVKLYGYGNTLLIFYCACVISSVINFLIARKYGKRIMLWLVGRQNFDKIEHIASGNENTLLVTARIFGYYWFDIMSYALGLTNVKFTKYFLYTIVLTPIPVALQYVVFRNINFDSALGLTIYIGSIALLAAVFIHVFQKIYKPK